VAANASKTLDKDHDDGTPISEKIKEFQKVTELFSGGS